MSATIVDRSEPKCLGELERQLVSTAGNCSCSHAISRTAPCLLRAGLASETGHREANEDCGYANVREGLFLVADGVGGSYGGAVASHLAVDTIPAVVLPAIHDGELNNDDLKFAMRRAIHAAQLAMRKAARSDSQLSEIG